MTEKFVLLMLAEYHRTDEKLSWPSVATLADDCLMEERSVSQILTRLVEKRFLVRTIGNGRGQRNAYQFIGLDVKKAEQETPFVETALITPHSQSINPAQPRSPYKERTGLTGEQGVVEHAGKLIQILGMSSNFSVLKSVEAGIQAEVLYAGRGLAETCQFIATCAVRDRALGVAIDKFYFDDTKWRVSGRRLDGWVPAQPMPPGYVSEGEKRRKEIALRKAAAQ